MRTLNIAISDVEYNRFGLKNNVFSFSDFVDMISKELMKKNIEAVVETAEKHGLSSLTMEDITAEVQAVRLNAKNNN